MTATGGARAPLTVRIAMWSARHRWLVFVLWFAGTLGTLGVSIAAGGINTIDAFDDPNGPRLESEEAYDVLGAGEPVAPAERLVIVIDGGAGAAQDPAFQQNVSQLAADLMAAKATVDGIETATFEFVSDPFAPGAGTKLISPDGTTVQIVGN